MKQFIYQLRAAQTAILTEGPTEREADLVGQHFAYLEKRVLTAELRELGSDRCTKFCL